MSDAIAIVDLELRLSEGRMLEILKESRSFNQGREVVACAICILEDQKMHDLLNLSCSKRTRSRSAALKL